MTDEQAKTREDYFKSLTQLKNVRRKFNGKFELAINEHTGQLDPQTVAKTFSMLISRVCDLEGSVIALSILTGSLVEKFLKDDEVASAEFFTTVCKSLDGTIMAMTAAGEKAEKTPKILIPGS